MVKKNTFIFLVCLIFLVIFFTIIYHSFNQRLSLLHKEKSLSSKGETLSPKESSEELENYPPCHSFGNIRWLHDISSGECYEEGTNGPCGNSMTFYQHYNKYLSSAFGFCDCDDVVEVKSKVPECEGVERPLVYDASSDRCYTVFSQGFCESEDEWVVLNDSLHPVCEKNPCFHLKQPKTDMDDDFSITFWIFHDKKCYRTMSRSYCGKGNILKVTKNNWYPECQKIMRGICPISVPVSIPVLQCRPGNKIHQLGICNNELK